MAQLPRLRQRKMLFFILPMLLYFFTPADGFCQSLWEVKFKHGQLIGQGFYQAGIKTPKYSKVASREEWLNRLKDSVHAGEHVVLFFHAMWGSNQQFFNKNLRYFEQEILSTSVSRVIFIRWKAPSIGYLNNVQKSIGYGELISANLNDITELLQGQNCKITLMAHSMGNRIAKGWLDSYKPNLEQIVLLAPDLSNSEFDSSNYYLAYTKKLHLFYNNNDRFLKWSSKLNKCSRLGRLPDVHILKDYTQIKLYNRTGMNDQAKLGGSFSGHIYYMNSPSTVELIRDILH